MTSAAPAYLPYSASQKWHAGAALDMPYGGSHRPSRHRNKGWPFRNGRATRCLELPIQALRYFIDSATASSSQRSFSAWPLWPFTILNFTW